jgi:hypothetical protein
MRVPAAPWAAGLLAAAAILLAPHAWAHGGGGFRGPAGAVPPGLREPGDPFPPGGRPAIACDCGKPGCKRCSMPGLEAGEGLSKRETRVEVLESWGALARVRVEVELATEVKDRFLEGFARVEQGPLFAVTSAWVTSGGKRLDAAPRPALEARRDYLWDRLKARDPLIVEREDAGTVRLRVFPVAAGTPTVVTLEGYAVLPARPGEGISLHRTGDRWLAVVPFTEGSAVGTLCLDRAGSRLVQVVDEAGCRRRWPSLMASATEVPCVPALEAAMRGCGDACASGETALVALEPGGGAPKDLFVSKPSPAPRSVPAPPAPPPAPKFLPPVVTTPPPTPSPSG